MGARGCYDDGERRHIVIRSWLRLARTLEGAGVYAVLISRYHPFSGVLSVRARWHRHYSRGRAPSRDVFWPVMLAVRLQANFPCVAAAAFLSPLRGCAQWEDRW